MLADVEVHRFGLQDQLLNSARKTNIPVAATVLGKSVIGEHHPFYLGIYEGAMGREDVRQYVESSDCVILLGAFMTDINLGVYTARLDPARSIYATSEKLSIRYHTYEEVRFKDFHARLAPPACAAGAAAIRSPAPIMPPSALRTRTPERPSQCGGSSSGSTPSSREHRRGGGRGGRAVWRGGSVHPRAHRIPRPRLLHLDGFCRAGEHRGPTGQPEACVRWCWSATARFR